LELRGSSGIPMQSTGFAAETNIREMARVGSSNSANPDQSGVFPDITPRIDYWLLGILLGIAGIIALWFFHSRNEILLSGDAVAHINIARRVFDSRTPGLLQLGSVWLPLPHLLTVPFVISDRMWQSGIGGAVVSVVSYVIAGLGIFHLLGLWSRLAGWIGTLFFAANPNLLYAQTTALNEPLYLAAFVWSVVFFVEAWLAFGKGEEAGNHLEKGAIAVTAAMLTRYDGWFLALVCWAAILPALLKTMRRVAVPNLSALKKSLFKALLLTALGPALWLAYNFGVYGNSLYFANGPYSARAIAQRTAVKGAPPYPGERNPGMAGVYFMKAAQLNVGEGSAAKLLLWISAIAAVGFGVRRAWLPFVLLWSPLAFYSLSIAYGSVPIFIPVWWPFSYYNVRYGLELLPALAAGLGLLILLIAERSQKLEAWSTSLVLLLGTFSYARALHDVPVCLREVRVNGQARLDVDRRMAAVLKSLPQGSTVLAYTGTHSGAFELADFPFRRTINEGNYVIWDSSLQHPAEAADFLIASDGEPVAEAVAKHPAGLVPTASIDVGGQPHTVVYESANSKFAGERIRPRDFGPAGKSQQVP
jgi:hypothetical protein